MPRLTPKTDIIRALFARSGNQCAFPGCTMPLINERNQFVAQVCHIEAALPGGERYNPDQNNEERRGYDNLVLFCYPHHIETNDVNLYKAVKLKRIKWEHEARFEKSDFKIDEIALFKIMSEMNDYWAIIERLNTLEHSMAELAFNINAKGSFFDVVRACHENIGYLVGFHDTFRESDNRLQADFDDLLKRKDVDPSLFNDIPYYENPLQNRNWEHHNLGIPNRMQRLKIDLMHMEIKYIEEFLKTNSKDQEAKQRLEHLKKEFADLAQNAIVVD
jgi:hypothetical protein